MERIVVKCGSESLINPETGLLDPDIFRDIARQVDFVERSGTSIVIVSSGGIRAGYQILEKLGVDASAFHKKDVAGVGARHLMNLWGDALNEFGREAMQLWVTYANWKAKRELSSIVSSLKIFSGTRITAVMNENDPVSPREIKLMERGISENDRLARMVAGIYQADGVIFLTKSGGIYEAHPKHHVGARMYREISFKTAKVIAERRTDEKRSGNGIGRKLLEAIRCAKGGMRTVIAGCGSNDIIAFHFGLPVGTLIGGRNIFYS